MNKHIYIVNCDKFHFFETFKTLDEVWQYLLELNKTQFDGKPFFMFGQNPNSNEWKMDSVVLCPKDDQNKYYTFFIRCIDIDGNKLNLE